MPQQPASERRSAERFAIAMPITMNDETVGGTHDISATGVLFDAPVAPRPGEQVRLTLLWGSEHAPLECQGEVVRAQRHEEGYNIAVRLSQPLFDDDGG
ncbi:MAG TPA: PilZ domain-containing protein [Ramlibacter sp.]|nr:PilZ domain-containing protein [Ramlibacter sp.]